MSDFDVQGARKAGYSDAEIADYLASSKAFDVGAARQAGYGDREIVDHLSPPPSAARQAVDAVSEAGSAAGSYLRSQGNTFVGGVMGLPRMAMEGIDYLSRKDAEHGGTGARLPEAVRTAMPTPREATDILNRPSLPLSSAMWSKDDFQNWLAKDAKTSRPDVNLPGPVGKVVDAGVQGVMSLPFMGATSLPGILANVGAPVVSEVLGQAAEGTKWETPVRLGGALVGAGGGAGIGVGVNKGAKTFSAMRAPFTAPGRDKIVGQAMVDIADDPTAALTGMQAYSPPVPGFKVTAAQASKDDALLGVQNALDRAGSGFGQQVKANNVTLTGALDALDAGMDPKKFVAEIAKQDAGAAMRAQAAIDALPAGADAATAGVAIRDSLRGRYEALDTARATATKPLYEQARAFPEDLRIGPLWGKVDDLIANSKGDIKAAAQNARKLLFDAKGRPDWSANGMMNTRAAVDDMLKKVDPGSNEQRILMGIKGEIDNSLSFVPAEQQARQTFAQMSRPLDPFSAKKGAPNVERVIEQDRFGNTPMMPAEKVPAAFFRSGDAGAATMKEFLAANAGNQSSIDAMKSFISDKARSAKDVKTFLQQNGPAIEALDPTLVRQLESAAATKSISQGYKSGPAGKFLEGDLDAAVKSTLGAPDSTKRMQALRMSVGGNPEAVQGLQKALLDDFRAAVSAPVAEDATGLPMLTANGTERWLKANRGAAANVLSPDQLAGIEAISRSLKDQGQTATKVAGSDTGRNLATKSILEAALWKGAGDAAWLAPIRKTLGWVYGGANEQAMDRLIEVMRDPKVAAALMKKATAGNANMAEPVLKSIARGSAVGSLEAGQ